MDEKELELEVEEQCEAQSGIVDDVQKRIRSKVLWVTLVAQVLAFLVLTGVIDITKSEAIQTGVGIILEILATFGILNNPTSKGSF